MSSSEDLARWDAIASTYAGTAGDSFNRRFTPFLRTQFGDIAGLRVLDLGCGHGWLAGELHRAGAHVIGIDGSQALIDIARRDYPDVEFGLHDLTSGLPTPPAREYDRVVSHMVLMDMPEIDRVLADVAASLSADGVLVFSILHPSFFDQAPIQDEATGAWRRHVRGYLVPEERWITSFGGHTHYHRPLSWYVDALARHDFAVTALHEPPTLPNHTRPPQEWTDYERWFSTIPTMLAVACRLSR
ncbi:class I SAM-dependent methyltransferase [Paractinoplanes lichenicola]|uniref:Methyltransferase domain-containing protein n=1 Tax=Paractinoplanes lichenicola TaxID=2802976 RepID=A0ABS1VVL0_9ACTN|nr:class I SAM-dependent methyltransferase [Actinoplanes lichenicola]MBL7258492.1 methyltransferase domain-containing protein [Actinoplanes lichenicola]